MQEDNAAKTKKQYILHYILRPDLKTEEELHQQRSAISVKIETAGGNVEASVCQDNARRLAYPIKKTERGYFCETAFHLDTQSVKGLYENLRLDPSLLRYTIEAKGAPAKTKPRRKAKPYDVQKRIPSQSIEPIQPKPDEQVEKMSIEELDKKLDEIIKNI